MTTRAFTVQLQNLGALLWCVGFFLVSFDLIGVDILGWKIPLCFAFFFAASGLCLWAEKREFSLRFALYRAHDLAIYTSWRFLLLYFLWINLFAPFTDQALRSVIYALGGWVSLVMVGFSAQFLFCERSPSRPVVLLRPKLRMLFFSFALASATGVFVLVVRRIWPLFPSLMRDEANFLLFLVLGLPFLLWDLLLHVRNLLPRWLSALVAVMVVSVLALTERKIFWIGLALCFAAILGLRIYKRMRFGRALFVMGIFLLLGFGVGFFALHLPIFAVEQRALEVRFTISLGDALRVAIQHNLLGTGIAVSPNRNGIWAQILAELGVVGFLFYSGFLLNLLWDLFKVGREPRIVVSDIALVSFGLFLVLVSHFYINAYAPGIWAWYAVWALLASSNVKKESRS